MAEYKFVVLDIRANLKEQSVFIDFSLDIDEDSISSDKIYLINQETKSIAPFSVVVDGKTIQLKLLDWAIPNDKYSLIVEAGITSIVDNTIDSSIIQDVVFESEVISDISIINPYNYQVYRDTVDLSWKEISTGDHTNSFYVEISNDTAFHNIIHKSLIDLNNSVKDMDNDFVFKTSLAPLKEYGQYYIRMRAQNSNGYGKWSDVVTFDFLEKKAVVPEKTDGENKDPDADIDNTTPGMELPDTNTSESGGDNKGEGTNTESPDTSEDNTEEKEPEKEGTTIEIEDLTGEGKKEIILDTHDVDVEYEPMIDILPENFSIFYPIDIDISQAEVTVIRRDI